MWRWITSALLTIMAILPARAVAWEVWPDHGRLRSTTITYTAPPEIASELHEAFTTWEAPTGFHGEAATGEPILIVKFGNVGIANTTGVTGCGADEAGFTRGCTMTIDEGIWAVATHDERLTLMLHEVGHVLGLHHSLQCSVMSYVCHTQGLTADDIEGGQWLAAQAARGGLVYRQSVAGIAND